MSDTITAPSLLGMAARFTKAAVRHAADGMTEVTPEQQAARLAVCQTCPYAAKNSCGICGCFLSKKAAWRSEDCPLEKWPHTGAGQEEAATQKPWCPKLREDLAITHQQTEKGSVYLLRDPQEGAFVRLGAAEHFIAAQFDGQTDLAEVRRRAEEQFAATLDPVVLERFIVKLRSQGLLEADGEEPASKPNSRTRLRGTLLHLRYRLFDPDRLLGWLARFSGPLCTRGFVVLGLLVCLAAVGVTVTHVSEVQRDLVRIYRPETIPLAILAVLAVILAHELAHGLTCKRFGGEVHEIGLLLIYFQPAFFCDVSSAWQFTHKSQRLWVTFAGAFCELLAWGSATLAWRLTEPETWINTAALVVMAASGIKSLFNLNPLIKLDGYYLLSDWLEIPNLRAKAFGYLRERAWPGPANASSSVPPEQRERRIYLGYGLLAGAYSAGLLAVAVYQSGAFLMTRYQALGLFVFVALWGLVFRQPLRRLLSRATGAQVPAWLRRGRTWCGLGLLACVPPVTVAWQMELRVTGEFEVLAVRSAEVRAEVEGFLDEICVEEGDTVAQGQVIARLSNRTYRAELEQVQAQLRQKEAQLQKLQAGPRAEEIAVAREALQTARTKTQQATQRHAEAEGIRTQRLAQAQATVEKTAAQLRYAQERLVRLEALLQRKVVTESEQRAAQESRDVHRLEVAETTAALRTIEADTASASREAQILAERECQDAQRRLDLLLAGNRPEDIAAAQAETEALTARREFIQQQLERVSIKSPLAGVVITRKLANKRGQHLSVGDLLVQVDQLDQVTAELAIPESEIGDVGVGRQVALKARAYPERVFLGTVSAVSATTVRPDEESAARIVLVSTRIENSDLLLKPGMTGKAKITCGERGVSDLAIRRLARTLGVEFWSWW